MKNSNIFWGAILLLTIYKIFSWRIKLGVPFQPGPEGLSFDTLIVVVILGYIVLSSTLYDEPWSWISLLKKFNSLMDREEKELDPTAFSDPLKNDPEYAKWERYFKEKSKNVGAVDLLPIMKNPPPQPMDKNKVYKGDILICKKSGIVGFYLGGGYEAIEDGVLKNEYKEEVKLSEFFGDWRDHFTKCTSSNSTITKGKTFSNTGPK